VGFLKKKIGGFFGSGFLQQPWHFTLFAVAGQSLRSHFPVFAGGENSQWCCRWNATKVV